VEPGNLFMLGYKDQTPIVSAPGCFRSAKLNVIDLVLPPMLARYRVSAWEIAGLGHGGLLDGREVDRNDEDRAFAVEQLHLETVVNILKERGPILGNRFPSPGPPFPASLVTGTGMPPAAGTRKTTLARPEENKITPL
jgi:hypothetical protein